MSEQGRMLSDEDVKAIVDVLEERMTEKFYRDLGKGVWGFFWRAIVIVMLIVAAWGAGHEKMIG